jgi:hypothetical protein
LVGAGLAAPFVIRPAELRSQFMVNPGFNITENFSSFTVGSKFDITAGTAFGGSPIVASPTDNDNGTKPLWTIVSDGFSGKGLQNILPQNDLGVDIHEAAVLSPCFAVVDSGYQTRNEWFFYPPFSQVINFSYNIMLRDHTTAPNSLDFDTGLGKTGKQGPSLQISLNGAGANTSGIKLNWRTSDTGNLTWSFQAYFYASNGNPDINTDVNGNSGNVFSATASLGTWYTVKQSINKGITGGSGQWAKVWLNGALLLNFIPSTGTDPVVDRSTWYSQFICNSWFGGNTCNNIAANDSYIVYDNFRLWSGTGP